MTLNGVMAVILRYFSEFALYLPGVLRKSSCSIYNLLMSSCYHLYYVNPTVLMLYVMTMNEDYIMAMFTGVSRWAETGVRSDAIDTRGSILTRVSQTVVGQRYAVR